MGTGEWSHKDGKEEGLGKAHQPKLKQRCREGLGAGVCFGEEAVRGQA